MPSNFTFKIRVKSEGSSGKKPYVGKDGKEFTNLMIGALESSILNLEGKMVAKAGLDASERVLWLNAIYFQRIIARTPRDETYKYVNAKGYKKTHTADDDYIQDYWTAKYWNYQGITAKYLRENCGCTFENFNDPEEIAIIYREFRNRFFGAPGSKGRKNKESGKTTLKSVRIYCDYPQDQEHKLRYHLLEFGGYVGDGIIKKGDERLHGVANGRSVQSPAGMKIVTDMEFESGQFRVPDGIQSNDAILNNIGPKQNMTKELKKILGRKKRLTSDDVNKIMELYGV